MLLCTYLLIKIVLATPCTHMHDHTQRKLQFFCDAAVFSIKHYCGLLKEDNNIKNYFPIWHFDSSGIDKLLILINSDLFLSSD